MAFLKRLKTLGRDTGGNALALCAAALPVVIAGAGLAVDTVQISLARRELQRAADSAALAGAYAINQNPVATGTVRSDFARNAATRDLEINNDTILVANTTIVQNAPTTGNGNGNTNAVRVQLTTSRALSFLSFFDATPQTVTVEATAAIVRDGNFCMLSLEDGTAPGITIGGNATINLGCGISANSRSTTAITAGGSSSVTASPIMAVGGLTGSSSFASGTQLIPYTAVQSDPFANLPSPSPTNCRAAPNSTPGSNLTISSASTGYNSSDSSICYNGFDIKGNVNFNFTQPTVVYINGGDLDFGSQANVTGTNVTFVLTSTNATSSPSSVAGLKLNGGARVNITAPSTGPYAGIAFYEDRRAPVGRDTKMNGGAGMIVNGAMYFPNGYFEYNGGANMDPQCIQLVARRLDFRGNGTVTNTCTPGGSTRNFQATYVRLIG